ncbi:hypothetical protein GLOTRDRAFT_89963 [Gloeophyllum trabeum ATCC 11539]|uniref:Uncharacterized protein n=1 Tax=Gloeophyllum trabeum (strain ATCC 11539 / FP-39264 / Madison 617) TaxID=670483 RepID=S7QLZ1_GLOTA|nr:uncharacterized protein GLOTRDRAFT_89963 [Gloeophyllum trabeum ATCC 11539]EPQ60457.1 hypothetical protein GLOTRDRAFT_89963 [Gloeophyllum trabeum ATCC 11539]
MTKLKDHFAAGSSLSPDGAAGLLPVHGHRQSLRDWESSECQSRLHEAEKELKSQMAEARLSLPSELRAGDSSGWSRAMLNDGCQFLGGIGIAMLKSSAGDSSAGISSSASSKEAATYALVSMCAAASLYDLAATCEGGYLRMLPMLGKEGHP